MDDLGIITSIDEIIDYRLGNDAPMTGKNGASLGMMGTLSIVGGGRSMDGYKVKTDKHEILILIDNGQSCCESFGYFSSDDALMGYIGTKLRDIELTDTALNVKSVQEKVEYGFDEGGVQFVTFKTDKGDFQLAVYNSHNGYYGHGIIIAKDNEILCQDTL